MFKALKIFRLVLREALMQPDLARTPEPTQEMNSSESVLGFHSEGAASLLPVYHFNALAIHALAPLGSSVLDLGCGSGQFLAYLAARRPDLRIIGLDLAEDMVRLGREMLARDGLADRVRLVCGDMREFRKVVRERVDLISSVFSLHHLPTHEDVLTCLSETAEVVAAHRASLWLFDLARPRKKITAEEFPEIFSPAASRAFREDTSHSLQAAWTFEELNAALGSRLPAAVRNQRARWMPLYQIHWVARSAPDQGRGEWQGGNPLPRQARSEAKALSMLFASSPQKDLIRVS